MAQSFNGITAFVNEQRARKDFWLEALFNNDTMPFVRSYGSVYQNVKENTFKLPKLTQTVGIKSGDDCVTDFNLGNDSTMTQTSISLTKGFIGDEFCPHGEAWETYFTALGMPAGQHYKSLGEWQPYVIGEIQRQVGKRLAINMWRGDQSGDTWTFTGWYEHLLAANMGTYNSSSNVSGGIVGSTTPTNGGTAGTDAQGVYNICQSLIEAALYTQQVNGADLAADLIAGNCVIVMNPLNREFLRQNYLAKHGLAMPEIAVGLPGLQNNAFGAFNFPGHNVAVVTQAWIPQTTIILTRKGNFTVAFDLESDFMNLSMGMDQYEEKMWWKYRFKVGTGFRGLTGTDMKYWGPTT